MLSTYFFYATGHQPTLSSIQWDAAFVGTGGKFSTHAVPAFLIIVNTFASQLWFGLTLPLLLLSPFTFAVMFPSLVRREEMREEMDRGELMLYEKEGLFHNALFSLSSKFVLLGALRVFSCMAAAAIHSRHLMVWKIFAPKLIFECLSLLVSMIGVLMGFMLVLRVTKAIKVLMQSLDEDN
ncbi:hypothetical protein J437_LFUL010473 [Ladona fulva]|uniref:GPI ethanolamine phosphate transferase 2 C-terminal domain-containing protein n=1 Tax=Ladona fulva TaxID=123851 RepID=A0A8K0KL80_LADFU|nr:hypothetical protein J437_LFUL010473 [Ladona fulva]